MRQCVYYHTEMVNSQDEASSLAHYMQLHGLDCFSDNESVSIPVVPSDSISTEKRINILVDSWQLFWENSDKGVFSLPIYEKTTCCS